jgi:TRAP-type C4-dicarboxylate transport system permease small subunit
MVGIIQHIIIEIGMVGIDIIGTGLIIITHIIIIIIGLVIIMAFGMDIIMDTGMDIITDHITIGTINITLKIMGIGNYLQAIIEQIEMYQQ